MFGVLACSSEWMWISACEHGGCPNDGVNDKWKSGMWRVWLTVNSDGFVQRRAVGKRYTCRVSRPLCTSYVVLVHVVHVSTCTCRWHVHVCILCTYYICTNDTCWWAWSVHHVELYFLCSQGKCQRKDPPCKYLHPPQHLREQLLQNGRNNLIIKQFQAQAITNQLMMPGVYPNMVNI